MKVTLKEKCKLILFGKEQSAGRKIYLDYLRMMATLFVIAVHTLELTNQYYAPGTFEFKLAELLGFVFISTNVLFIMVSGALLLPVTGESAGKFYKKRFLKVIIPMLVYYIIYVCAKEGIACLAPSYWRMFLIRILSGPPVEAPHFWLIYVILGLYVLTPLFRYLVQNISDAVLCGVIVVIFLINAIDTYLPLFDFESPFSVVVDSFAGVFLLGYYLAGRCSKRAENILIVGGVLSFAVTGYIIFFHGWYEDYIYNNAPTMMFFASAIFLLVKYWAENKTETGKFVRLISRHSFSILLIHWAMLHVAVKDVLGIGVMSGGVFIGFFLMTSLTLIFSLVGGILLENTLIRAIYFLIDKLGSLFQKKKG